MKRIFSMPQLSRLVTALPLLLLTATASSVNAGQSWQHEGKPAQLVELFTSEGCSSCPPADKYLSRLQDKTELWKEVIPLAFHVDYWNYLGWKDKFSHPSFSQRQRIYQSYGAATSVYTPGFFVDGKEWQGYFYRQDLPQASEKSADKLTLTRNGSLFDLTYKGEGKYSAHLALLAMDETTQVRSGENRGKSLKHDFIVLEKQQMTSQNNWQFNLSSIPENADAVAVWLTRVDGFKPVQTVAGFLEKNR